MEKAADGADFHSMNSLHFLHQESYNGEESGGQQSVKQAEAWAASPLSWGWKKGREAISNWQLTRFLFGLIAHLASVKC